jgi:hypothetical protein
MDYQLDSIRLSKNIKEDLKEMLDKFHSGQLGIGRLNHGIITLIPKVLDAVAI